MYGDVDHVYRGLRSLLAGPKPWFIAHAVVGLVGMLMALRLVGGRSPMERPVQWMRMTLIFLIVAIFLAAVTRYIHLHLRELDLFQHYMRAPHSET
jgi:hypothetical protein